MDVTLKSDFSHYLSDYPRLLKTQATAPRKYQVVFLRGFNLGKNWVSNSKTLRIANIYFIKL